MGMDVFGINPTINKGSTKPSPPAPGIPATSQEFQEYMEAAQVYEDNNPGVYFRASCWSWRPILNLIYIVDEKCDLNLDPEILEGMSFNDGWGFEDQKTCNILATAMELEILDYEASGYDIVEWDCGDPQFQEVYKTTVEHVRMFITFLRHCGGFQVC